jgi:hypothetical protein
LLAVDTGIKVHVAGEDDDVDRFRWLGHIKLFDLTGDDGSKTSQMLMANQHHCVRDGGPFPIRIAWVRSKGNAGFFTKGDSGIKTPRDIKPGTRFCRMTYSPKIRMIDGLLAWAKVRHDEIIWVDINKPGESYQSVVEGRSDLSFGFPNSPNILAAERKKQSIKWVDLNAEADPEGAKRFRDRDPLITFGLIHSGVDSAIGHWGTVGINFELTRKDTNAELVYNLAKWLDENYPRFKDKHPQNKFRNRQTLIEGLRHTYLPCHEGTISYLRDIGIWTKAHDMRQAENESLVDQYAMAYQQCMWEADRQKIWVARESEEWVKFWNDYKKSNLPELKLFDDLPVVAV